MLVEVRTHDRGAGKQLRIEVDGRDVLSSFRVMPDGSRLGLVTGLSAGPHTIVARANGSGEGDPAGTHRPARGGQPPDHRPAVLRPAAAAVLLRDRAERTGTADRRRLLRTDAGHVPLPDDGRCVRPLADPSVRPADVARTTTLDGRTVDYIVRLERGTIDRAVYEIAALHDPASRRARSRLNRGGTSASSTRSAVAATSATTRERARAASSPICSCPAAMPSPRRASTSTRRTAARSSPPRPR